MPAAAGIGAAIAGLAAGAATIYAAKKQSKTTTAVTNSQIQASNEAAKIEEEATKRQEAFLKEQDEKDRLERETVRRQTFDSDEEARRHGYESAEAARKSEYDRYTNRSNNLRPYLGMGQAATGNLAHLMGLSPSSMQTPNPSESMPYQPVAPYKPQPYTPLSTSSAIPGGSTLASVAAAAPAQKPASTPTLPVTPPPTSFLPTDSTAPVDQSAQPQTPPQTGVELVWMQAPDGTMKQVPPFSVPYFLKMGAKVMQTATQ